jgi:PAS domain S-box-containing protein
LKRVSPSYATILGWSEAEMLAKPLFEFLHPDDLEAARKAVNAHGEGGDGHNVQNRCLCKDGSYKWLSWNSHSLVREKLIIGVARDVTEHRQWQERLQQSEERYRTLFNTMIEGFCLIEVLFDQDDHPVDYRFLEVNPAFERQTGLRNPVGKLMRELAPEPDAHWLESYGKVARTGESARFTAEVKTLTRWLDVSAYRVAGKGNNIIAVLFNDVTQAREAATTLQEMNRELEIRVSERTEALAGTIGNLREEIVERGKAEEGTRRLNLLYALLSDTNQAIVRCRDRDSLFREVCNIAVGGGSFLLAWVGLLDEDSGGVKIVAADGPVDYLDGIEITSGSEPAGLGPTGQAIRDGTYCICNDFLHSPLTRPWHEKGRAHGIRASASIALLQEDRVVGALTLYADKKDFFDRRQVDLLRQVGADLSFALDNMLREAHRQEAEHALREEIVERLRAVEALREKEQMLIQQGRLAAMGEMIGNIAHQWRQPLNMLGLLAQKSLLFYDLGEFDRTFLAETVTKEMDLIQHMSKTIDDFGNYFKPNKEKTGFVVLEVIENTLSLLKGSLQSPLISVEIVEKAAPVIYGYPNEFSQVLLNILINAKDVLTERETEAPRVTITVFHEAGRAVVTVADNAGGIPVDIMDRIFEPYFTTKGPQQGTGIGLFMSKTIIEKNMGGRLSVRNAPKGAEFRIEVCNAV